MVKSLLIAFALMNAVLGQVGKSRLRVIAMGNDPREDLAFIPPPLTYLPPMVFVRSSDEKVAGVALRLGELSDLVEVPGGLLQLSMSFEKGAGALPWVEVSLPVTGNYLVVLTKSTGNQNGGWKRVQSKVVDLGVREIPKGAVRFVNASARRMLIRMGEQRSFFVGAGAVVIRERPPEGTSLKISVEGLKGGWHIAFSGALSQVKEGEQLSYLAFEDQESTVKVNALMETVGDSEMEGP